MRSWVLSVILCSGLVATAMPPAHADAKGKKIAHVTLLLGNPFVSAVAKAVVAEAKSHGATVNVFGGPFDAALQSRQIDDAIARKYDAILLFPADPNALLPALNRAKKAGIPVVIVNSKIAPGHENLFVSYVGEDQKALGRIAGEFAAKAVAGRKDAKAAIISGTLSESTPQARVAGFKEALAKHPNIKLVAVEDARWDMAKSEQLAGQLFARFQGQGGLDVVFAMADYMAFGVIKSAKTVGVQLGTKKGQLVVVAGNCGIQGINAILAGDQYSTTNSRPARLGREATKDVVAHLSNKKVQKIRNLPVQAITKANAARYRKECTY